MNKKAKIVITGAAGLVGQNLTYFLCQAGFSNLVAIDKHPANLAVVQELNPGVKIVLADLSKPGVWEDELQGTERLFLLQARITAADWVAFERDTLSTTRLVIEAARKASIPFTVFAGSSVVNSVADDNYTRSKKTQEEMFLASDLPGCVARPTLMFGWFDPKHLGWLSRFMAKTPAFPIPGHGRYARQPLYVRDFCKVLTWCAEHTPHGQIYDIVGQEEIDYVDIIKTIKKVLKLKTIIIHIPVPLFRFLLNAYSIISKNPPFVADQLDALMAGDHFSGNDLKSSFNIDPTPFEEAISETFTHPENSRIVLER